MEFLPFIIMSYKIQAGDTLWAIGQKRGVSVDQLEAANPGVNPTNLQVGHDLKIPGGGEHSNGHPPVPSGNGYLQYSGPASHFPAQSQWAQYDRLWPENERLMKFHDSDAEIAMIRKSIDTVAHESGVDARVILCIVVQESGGNVRVPSVSTKRTLVEIIV